MLTPKIMLGTIKLFPKGTKQKKVSVPKPKKIKKEQAVPPKLINHLVSIHSKDLEIFLEKATKKTIPVDNYFLDPAGTLSFFKSNNLSNTKIGKIKSFCIQLFETDIDVINFCNSEKINRWLAIAGQLVLLTNPIADKKLKMINVLIVDMDLGLHPMTSKKLLSLLNKFFDQVNIYGTCNSLAMLGLEEFDFTNA